MRMKIKSFPRKMIAGLLSWRTGDGRRQDRTKQAKPKDKDAVDDTTLTGVAEGRDDAFTLMLLNGFLDNDVLPLSSAAGVGGAWLRVDAMVL